MAKREVIVVFGNQLVPDHPALRKHPDAKVVMIEADDICQAHMYHKHKLMLVFSAMRSYADGLNRDVEYIQYQPGTKFKILLQDTLAELLTTDVIWMHASDRGPNRMLSDLCTRQGYKATVYPNKQFMTTTALFGSWLDAQKSINPLMETFYRWQRTRLDILMDGAKPTGGKWNYDHDNRKPLPKNHIEFPALPPAARTDHVRDIAELIDRYFGDNPGSTDTFWLPTTRREALTWLSSFVSDRLAQFGTYEDAMRQDTPFLYHSVLSPLLNVGLLTPDECVKAALNAHDKEAPLNSVEGFIRQIIGWREFVHGLYWWKSDSFKGNFFGFSKPLETWWFSGQDIPDDLPLPLKDCLRRVHTYGYSHHIERLMVFGNWFLLNGYDPADVYRWFMSLYVDAYEWVMIPNVIGMSQFADGGMLATKPYVSGGNYLQKMGSWWDSADQAKQSAYTDKYWQFIYDNRDKFSNNHRMSLVVAQAAKRFETT